MLSDLHPCGDYKVFTVGTRENAELRLSHLKDLGERGIEFQLYTREKEGKFRLGIPGLHNGMNAALAVGAALGMGLDMEQAASGLAKVTSTDKRLNILQVHGIKIIDDSYNASPDSMKAALDVLASIKGTRKIAILGDMFELGKDEENIIGRSVNTLSKKASMWYYQLVKMPSTYLSQPKRAVYRLSTLITRIC